MLRNITYKLRDLDVVFQLALEASEQYLPLARLEAVHYGGNGPLSVIL